MVSCSLPSLPSILGYFVIDFLLQFQREIATWLRMFTVWFPKENILPCKHFLASVTSCLLHIRCLEFLNGFMTLAAVFVFNKGHSSSVGFLTLLHV